MPVFISMLRGINLGAHNRIKMDALRAMYESLKLEDVRTYVQSGNVIFHTKEKDAAKLAKRIQDAILETFDINSAVILRTTGELRKTMAENPFAKRKDIEPAKLLVTFLAGEPPGEASAAFEAFKQHPEEIHLRGSELYIYFPNGAGRSKLPWAQMEKLIQVTGTARNWNSVTKMLAMAEELEAK
jgi:uncharacterized protein (DUF1697 family)